MGLTGGCECFQDLYHDGINREYFVPFLHQLARHTRVVDINSQTDYRMLSEVRTFLCISLLHSSV
jgi:predicted ATPase